MRESSDKPKKNS